MSKIPLLMKKSEFERILSHLTIEESERAEAERYRTRLDRLTQTSESITHAWPDSIANITKKNEEIRAQKREKMNIKDREFYIKYMSDLEEKKKRLLELMHLRQFKDTDAPKTLLSNFLLCDVLRGRELQIAFNNERQAETTAREKKYANDLRDKCNQWREREKLRVVCRKNKSIEDAKELKRLANEVEEKKRHGTQQAMQMELQDIAIAARQMQEIKEFEVELAKKDRERFLIDVKVSQDMIKKKQEEDAITEKLDEKLCKIYLKSKHTIDCIRKQKEAEYIEEKRKLANALSDKLSANMKIKEEAGAEIAENNLKRLLKKEQMRREADEKKKQLLVEEVQEVQRQFLQDRQQQRQEKQTIAAWEMINSIKNVEMAEEFYKEERNQRIQKEIALKEGLLMQQEERRLRELEERVAIQQFYADTQRLLHNLDTETIQHATSLLDECQRTKRPDYPVRKTLQKYKKANQLNSPPISVTKS